MNNDEGNVNLGPSGRKGERDRNEGIDKGRKKKEVVKEGIGLSHIDS